MRRALMVALVAMGVAASGAAIAQSNDRGIATPAGAPSGASPAAVVGGNTINSDSLPQSAVRLFRDGTPSVCGATKAFPGPFSSGGFAYQTISYTNTGGPRCVIFTLTSSCTGGGNLAGTFLAAYSGAIDPDNLGTGYLADSGSSTGTGTGINPVTLGISMAANQTINVMIQQVNPAATSPVNSCSYLLQDNREIVVPTMSPAAMAAMAAILALLGFLFLRRRAMQR